MKGNTEKGWDVVVVGGGPAGMVAAARAAERGLRVVLLEKNTVLGAKLLLTGGGRCNITNATSDRHVLIARYGENGVHLHSLFSRFSPDDTRSLFRRLGLETKVEAEGRVFPVTESAVSVRDVLERYLTATGVVIRRNTAVAEIEIDGVVPGTLRRIAAVVTHRGEAVRGGSFVFATGGTARPETGSTGDAFPWFQRLGVAVRVAESSLVPLRVPDRWVRDLQGLALADAELIVQGGGLSAGTGAAAPGAGARNERRRANGSTPGDAAGDLWANGKRLLTRRGKLLFTHFGLSGPLALNAAQDIRELSRKGPIRLLVNPLPGTDPGTIDRQILEGVARSGNRKIVSLLGDLLPPRLARQICVVAGVPEDQRLASLSRVQRRQIVSVITAAPCTFRGLMGSDKAVVSSGGVDPGEVDFRTMRLRRVSNAYVLGDLLDFNRSSGGYSLQICWAGGWVAGSAVD